MKKYIGTKQIEAEPMNLGEFIKQTGRNPYANSSDMHGGNEEGYIVEYEDGYKSWSPKKVFERAYKVSETFLDRMKIERNELIEKYIKLADFINSGRVNETVKDDYQKFLLCLQEKHMAYYLDTLNGRISRSLGEPGTLCRFSFGVAIEALKFGLAIRRKGWNGKGLFVVKQVPAHIESNIISKMQSLPQSAKDLILNGKGFVDYTSQCLIYNENTGRADSWAPSISDVFADDWEIVI